jgi:peroxygenase
MPDSTSTALTNGSSTHHHHQSRTITTVPVTTLRTPFQHTEKTILEHAGEPRASLAPSNESPNGTTADGWDKRHRGQTVLQQHCEFFDRDRDGEFAFPWEEWREGKENGGGVEVGMVEWVWDGSANGG